MRSQGTSTEHGGLGKLRNVAEHGSTTDDTATIAVCASAAGVCAQISAVISLSDHQLLPSCQSAEEVITLGEIADAELLVIAPEPEPFKPSLGLAMLRAELSTVPIVLVTSPLIISVSSRLIRSAIDGVVFDTEIENALVPTINAVLGGQLCVPLEMRDELARPVLSHREKQVLELVGKGLTNVQIAAQLYLAQTTVQSHLASSCRKLGVSTRTEAARKALGFEPGLAFPTQPAESSAATPVLRQSKGLGEFSHLQRADFLGPSISNSRSGVG